MTHCKSLPQVQSCRCFVVLPSLFSQQPDKKSCHWTKYPGAGQKILSLNKISCYRQHQVYVRHVRVVITSQVSRRHAHDIILGNVIVLCCRHYNIQYTRIVDLYVSVIVRDNLESSCNIVDFRH